MMYYHGYCWSYTTSGCVQNEYWHQGSLLVWLGVKFQVIRDGGLRDCIVCDHFKSTTNSDVCMVLDLPWPFYQCTIVLK